MVGMSWVMRRAPRKKRASSHKVDPQPIADYVACERG